LPEREFSGLQPAWQTRPSRRVLLYGVLVSRSSAKCCAGLRVHGERGAIFPALQPARLRSSRRRDVWDLPPAVTSERRVSRFPRLRVRDAGQVRIVPPAVGKSFHFPKNSILNFINPAGAVACPGIPLKDGARPYPSFQPPGSRSCRTAGADHAPPHKPRLICHNAQLASPPERIGDGEHEEFGERDTLDQEKRPVSAEYP
jgi:hypothetical protein